MMNTYEEFDAVIVGGGPSGSTAANELAREGHNVLLLERGSRIKPCGGAIPPVLIEEFGIPDSLLVAHINSARMISPSNRKVDMPINGGFVGMVDRDAFDPWLRSRAQANGADVRIGKFTKLEETEDKKVLLSYVAKDENQNNTNITVKTKMVIGADGSKSAVARQVFPQANKTTYVGAYHEIVQSPANSTDDFDPKRCDVFYQGEISPDFYGWIFPHGDKTSIGVGSATRGFSVRDAVSKLRDHAGLSEAETVRVEGAPIPMKPLKKWDNGRNVLLAGDAAGVVAPASGEGIYYAMTGGKIAAETVSEFLATQDVRVLAKARKSFMKKHGKVFWVLGIMQKFWYCSDKRRERFVSICKDKDVQDLTWQSYMHKKLERKKPLAHARIFFKDLAHLLGVART